MASLKVVSDRLDDNSLKVAVVIPPRRNGEPNFGALERAIYGLHVLNPDAFDPHDVPHTLEAPMPPTVEFVDDDEPGSLKAGEAYRGAA